MSEERVGEKGRPQAENTGGKTVTGLLIAPFAGSVGAALVLLVIACVQHAANAGLEFLYLGNVVAILGFAISLAIMIASTLGITASIALGLPSHLLLKRAGQTHLIAYSAAGSLVGAISGTLYALFVGMTSNNGFWALPGGLAGAFGGLTFWVIRRPDRDTTSVATPPKDHGA